MSRLSGTITRPGSPKLLKVMVPTPGALSPEPFSAGGARTMTARPALRQRQLLAGDELGHHSRFAVCAAPDPRCGLPGRFETNVPLVPTAPTSPYPNR